MEHVNASCECEIGILGFKKIPPPPPLPFFLQEQYLNEISAITDNRLDFKNETFETCHLCHWAQEFDSRFLSEMLETIKTGNLI